MSVLQDVFSVEAILGGRGIKLKSKEYIENPLIKNLGSFDQAYQHIKDSGTRTLPDPIGLSGDLSRNEINQEEAQQFRASALEWFISEVLKREFYFHSSKYGVEIEGGNKPIGNGDNPMGDFDVVGIARNLEPVFIECKSGDPANITVKKFYNAALRGIAVQSPYTVMVCEQSVSMDTLKRKLNSKHWPAGEVSPGSRECNVCCISPIDENQSEFDVFMWGALFIVNMYSKDSSFVLLERLGNVFKIVGALKSGLFWAGISYQAIPKDELLLHGGFKVQES